MGILIAEMKIDDRGKVLCPVCGSTIKRTAMHHPRNETHASCRCSNCKAYLRGDIRMRGWIAIILTMNAHFGGDNTKEK